MVDWSDLSKYLGGGLGGAALVKLVDISFSFFLQKKKQDVELDESRTTKLEEQVEKLEDKTRSLFEEHAKCLKESAQQQSEILTLKASVSRMEMQIRSAHITCDDTGKITEWTSGATTLFGYGRDEVLGQHVSLLIPNRLRGQHDKAFQQAVAEHRGPSEKAAAIMRESYGMTKDGNEIPVTIVLNGWEFEGRRFYSADIKWR